MWLLRNKHRHIRHIRPETLNEYLDGRLSGNGLAKIEGRLRACDACQDELEELRATIAVVRQMPMEAPRRSFVMDAPPPQPARARQSFQFRAPAWAYAGAASIAVVALAVLVSVDATGGLSPAADSPEAVVAAAPQSRAVVPEAAATAVPGSQADVAPTPDQEIKAAAAGANQASRLPAGDGSGEAESTSGGAAQEGEDSAAFTVTTAAAPSDSTAVEEPGTPSAAALRAAEPLPEPPRAPASAVESAPSPEIDETPGGTSVWWRVLEGVAAAAALAFVAVLVWARRSSHN
jgi:hypothetical protein